MKIYKKLFKEKRLKKYKAWYNPNTDFFIQFNTNLLHSEIAEEKLHKSEEQAINNGYYRIFCRS
jgi:hypothetical protein